MNLLSPVSFVTNENGQSFEQDNLPLATRQERIIEPSFHPFNNMPWLVCKQIDTTEMIMQNVASQYRKFKNEALEALQTKSEENELLSREIVSLRTQNNELSLVHRGETEASQRRIQILNKTIQEQAKRIQAKEKIIQAGKGTIQELERRLQTKESFEDELERIIQIKNESIQSQKRSIQALERHLQSGRMIIRDLDRKVLALEGQVQVKDRTIQSQEESIRDLDRKVAGLEGQVQVKDRTIQSLEEFIQAL